MTLATRIAEVLPGRTSRLTIPLLVAAIVLLALFTPAADTDRAGDPRLSSFLAGPNGAKGIYDVAHRLGWRTERKTIAPLDSITSGTIVALLAPPQNLSERETALLLQRVRDGASLLTVINADFPLQDSLHLSRAARFVDLPVIPPGNVKCPGREPRSVYQLIGDQAVATPFLKTTRLPPGSQVFLTARDVADPKQMRFAGIGFPFGKGRIVAVSDANVLRNDFIRVCKWGVGASVIQMLEYLSAGRQRSDTRIIFDEFHQGFGPQPSVTRAIGRVLFNTAPGGMLVQIIIASGILLLAIGPRPIPPAPSTRVQRRSQFEHVEALSAAYQQIAATRVVTERLVRGLRRRLASGSTSSTSHSGTDIAFLRQVAATHPQVSAEVAAVTAALTEQSSPAQLIAAGEAIETIERTIKH